MTAIEEQPDLDLEPDLEPEVRLDLDASSPDVDRILVAWLVSLIDDPDLDVG